ncbi:hypothetical protein [Salinimicrobium sp. HB62]|uniref:hypothetical protein n=1 Tax=Salinimicrobium sp. HB62 TaxID=3077781 RepID=UPI002D78C28E|nr:hypothetical protein [Salinimicrobium sp. HB62]
MAAVSYSRVLLRFSSIFFFFLLISCTKTNGELLFNEKAPEAGFNFPYYLFIPEDISESSPKYLIVETNNSGFASDDFKEHLEKAGRTASKDFYLGNYAAVNLGYPLLVPVFPRSKATGNMYTHSLDRDVMLQKGTQLERIDLQVLEMVEDARERLKQKGLETEPEILMTGFSASGTFANRFSLLHPDKIKAVAAGGLNGILMLPFSEENEVELTYPAGTKDFEHLFGKPFDSIGFRQTPQFLFMGAQDENDALPYDDAYDPAEREAINTILGKEMLPTRWNKSKEYYLREGVNAEVRTFEEVGHEHPQAVKDEVVEFFRRIIKSEIGERG